MQHTKVDPLAGTLARRTCQLSVLPRGSCVMKHIFQMTEPGGVASLGHFFFLLLLPEIYCGNRRFCDRNGSSIFTLQLPAVLPRVRVCGLDLFSVCGVKRDKGCVDWKFVKYMESFSTRIGRVERWRSDLRRFCTFFWSWHENLNNWYTAECERTTKKCVWAVRRRLLIFRHVMWAVHSIRYKFLSSLSGFNQNQTDSLQFYLAWLNLACYK